MPRASTLLDWADVRVGFPSALMTVVALMAFFCSIHSFLCSCGDHMERIDRHLTSERCNTLSMAKTLGKAHVLSITIQSHIVFIYIITVRATLSHRSFCQHSPNLQCHSQLVCVEPTHSERCTLEDISIITAILLLLLFLLLVLLFVSLLLLSLSLYCYYLLL